MTWSEEWADLAESGNRSPIYLLTDVGNQGGARVLLSSHPWPGYTVALLADECSISWGIVSPPLWEASESRAAFAIAPDVSLAGVRRGSIVQLSIVLNGIEEPVWVGRLTDVRRPLRGPAVLDCIGLEGALWERIAPVSTATLRPFRRVGDAGVLGAPYSATAPNIVLAGSPTFEAASTTGAHVIRVVPTTGEPFYLAGLASSGGMVSVEPTGTYDTIPVDALTGDAYTVVAYDHGHPIDLVSRCLDDADGTWPDSWRMRLPSGTYDRAEADRQVAAYGLGSNNRGIKLRIEEGFDRFGDYLRSLCGDVGVVLTQRHGQVVPRIILAPVSYYSETPIEVTEANIVDIETSAWAPYPTAAVIQVYDRIQRAPLPSMPSDAAGTPFGSLKAAMALAGLPEPLPPTVAGSEVTLGVHPTTIYGSPKQVTYDYRIPAYGGSPGPYVPTDRTAWRADVVARLREYMTASPESATVTISGWSRAAIGDALRIDLRHLVSREDGAGAVWRGQPCLVIGGGPDFFGATSTYQVLAVSTDPTT